MYLWEKGDYLEAHATPTSTWLDAMGLPHGWMQWGTDMICTDCIYKMLHAAMTAAMQKISQIKEEK
jgi:hypothetical protein